MLQKESIISLKTNENIELIWAYLKLIQNPVIYLKNWDYKHKYSLLKLMFEGTLSYLPENWYWTQENTLRNFGWDDFDVQKKSNQELDEQFRTKQLMRILDQKSEILKLLDIKIDDSV